MAEDLQAGLLSWPSCGNLGTLARRSAVWGRQEGSAWSEVLSRRCWPGLCGLQRAPQHSALQWHSPVCLLGFQVYQLDTGHYLCRNKYYGRGLSIEGFRSALYQYLHNGLDLRRDLFEPILSKLRGLKAVLERQASYRFYSSSLLVIYDGKECWPESCLDRRSEMRLKHLDTGLPEVVPLCGPSTSPGSSSSTSLESVSSPKVDVRMIDFAHSTFKGFRDDPTVHDGPDRGYVFGLENLISIMEQMRDENQ